MDLNNANVVIDRYLLAIRDKSQLPGKHNRTWLEFEMQRCGLIQCVRKLGFGESHAIWYSALILTGRVNEVNRAEIANRHKLPNGKTTAKTIKAILSPAYSTIRDTLTARMVREMVKDHNHQNP